MLMVVTLLLSSYFRSNTLLFSFMLHLTLLRIMHAYMHRLHDIHKYKPSMSTIGAIALATHAHNAMAQTTRVPFTVVDIGLIVVPL